MSVLENAGALLVFVFFMSLVIERVIELVVKPAVKNLLLLAGKTEAEADEAISRVAPLIAAILGAVVAIGFGIDLFAGMAEAAGLNASPLFTRALTAVVFMGGSNLLHDLWPQEIVIGEIEPMPWPEQSGPHG